MRSAYIRFIEKIITIGSIPPLLSLLVLLFSIAGKVFSKELDFVGKMGMSAGGFMYFFGTYMLAFILFIIVFYLPFCSPEELEGATEGCDLCYGRKVVTRIIESYRDVDDYSETECPRCKGTGSISRNQAERNSVYGKFIVGNTRVTICPPKEKPSSVDWR